MTDEDEPEVSEEEGKIPLKEQMEVQKQKDLVNCEANQIINNLHVYLKRMLEKGYKPSHWDRYFKVKLELEVEELICKFF